MEGTGPSRVARPGGRQTASEPGHSGQRDFEGRYEREYLSSEKFRGFDDALVRLLELLDFPGVGKVLAGAMTIIRSPLKLLGGLLSKAVVAGAWIRKSSGLTRPGFRHHLCPRAGSPRRQRRPGRMPGGQPRRRTHSEHGDGR